MKNKLKYVLVPLVVFVVLRILFITDFWVSLEHKARDMFFLIRGAREVSDDIVIVEIGDGTFNTLAERWPFPRRYHARLIENLEKAGVKQIIFDIEFTEHSDPEDDKILQEACAKYDNVILSGKLIKTIHNNAILTQFLPPLKKFLDTGTEWGMVNISAEKDGFVRKYELFQRKKDDIKLSLSVLALREYYEKVHKTSYSHQKQNKDIVENFSDKLLIGNNQIPKTDWNKTLLNYYGPARTFQTVDYSDVIDDSTFITAFEKELESDLNQYYSLKEKLNGKTVFIGLTSVEFHDTHHTPFFSLSHELTPGVEIHATFLEMAKRQDYLYEFNYLYFLLIFLVLSYVLFIIAMNIKPTHLLFLNIFLVVFYFFFSFQMFANNSIFLPVLEIPVLIILLYIIGLIFHYIKTSQERKFIKDAFGQYIAPELVNELLSDPAKLEYGGEQKEISVLYSDIVSFTPYTESHTPKETVDILREYLTEMVDIITKNKGTLDKFVGDEIVALFGAPLEIEDHAYWACKAAIEMRERMEELRIKWQEEKKDPFEIGIGINSGVVTVGNLGSEQIFDYTAIGDNMNAGARLEALTRDYETKNNIIISESTFQLAEDRLIGKFIAETKVKGKNISVRIYELIGIKKEISVKKETEEE